MSFVVEPMPAWFAFTVGGFTVAYILVEDQARRGRKLLTRVLDWLGIERKY